MAYCATPRPNDQFSGKTSTRLTKTSWGRTPGFSRSRSTQRANSASLGERARIADGQLDHHEIIAMRNIEISWAIEKVIGVVFRDGHEKIVLGHVECLAHSPVKAVGDICLSCLFWFWSYGRVSAGRSERYLLRLWLWFSWRAALEATGMSAIIGK